MCTIGRKIIIITSYDVSIGSWLDLLQLVWIGLAWPPRKKMQSKQLQNKTYPRASLRACIPVPAECDFDVCKNVLLGCSFM